MLLYYYIQAQTEIYFQKINAYGRRLDSTRTLRDTSTYLIVVLNAPKQHKSLSSKQESFINNQQSTRFIKPH
jgi:hypothetical protein